MECINLCVVEKVVEVQKRKVKMGYNLFLKYHHLTLNKKQIEVMHTYD